MEISLRKFVCVVLALLCYASGSYSQQIACGQAQLNTKIVGGQDADTGSWPWQVSIQTLSGMHFCGGSLISQNWVLSAAHCFQSVSASSVKIEMGLNSLENPGSNMQNQTVTKILNHPNYNSVNYNNDVALLQLSSPVTFNNYIQPVCLAAVDSSFLSGIYTWITGWGTIRSGVSLPSPQNLQEVAVPVVSNSKCANYYGSIITSNMLCAGVSEGGKDSCQGDSGGPLVVKQDSRWILGGIVSFGDGCAKPEVPGVYTRVSQYQNWISNQISDQLGFVTYSACGQAQLNTKIVGGQDADTGSWPWQVSIQSLSGMHFCGGSLISQNWVLSAAHCFQSVSASSVKIEMGLNSLENPGSNMQSRSVTKILNHPNYDSENNNNDVALLQLSSPVTFNNYIQPVCLAAVDSSFPSGIYTWITGWGDTESGVSLPSPQNLQEVAVPVVSNSKCANYYGSNIITSNMLCAGVSEGGKDSCQGDSGGPLVVKQDSRWILGGIVSFGDGCAKPEVPGVYTRVSQYQNWISDQISDQLGFVTYSGSNNVSHSVFSLSLSLIFFFLSLYVFF